MSTNEIHPQESIAREHFADELSGLYPIDPIYKERGAYPATAEQVYIEPAGPDGYHDIVMFNVDGEIVATNNRAQHRIEGALEGGDGYTASLAQP